VAIPDTGMARIVVGLAVDLDVPRDFDEDSIVVGAE